MGVGPTAPGHLLGTIGTGGELVQMSVGQDVRLKLPISREAFGRTSRGGGSMSHRARKFHAGLMALLVAVPFTAAATEYHGQVLFDGNPVPGAVLTAKHDGKTETAVTNAQGVYTFANLADGTWTVDVKMTGFAPVEQQVTIAPNVEAGKYELKLMSLDALRAALSPIVVDSASATVATAATPATVETKGKAKAGGKNEGAAATATAPQAAGAGGAEAASAATASAATPSNNSEGLLINGSVNNAATSQFSLSQAFGNARNSRSLYNGGFVLNVQNSALDAKPYSLTGLDTPKPAYNNFTVGFQIGGPLKIPHLFRRGPNFFVGYERAQEGADSTSWALVPTLAERLGNFSQYGQTLYAPAAGLSAACLAAGVKPGQPIPGNTIPGACISPAAQRLLAFYPTPTITNNALYNYQAATTTSMRQDRFQARLNRAIGNKNYVFGTFGWQSTRQGNNTIFGFHDATQSLGMNGNVNWTHRFTQRLGTTAGYTYSRSRTRVTPYFANRVNVEGQAGITGVDQTPQSWGPPGLGFSSGLLGLSDANSSFNRSQTNSVSLQMNWNKFRHNVQAGFDFSRREWNYFQQANPRGSFGFTGAATAGTAGTGSTGSDLADFLLGVPDTSQISYGNPDKYLRESLYDGYVTDDFRVNPEFSLNAGVRWEYFAPITELKNRLVNIDAAPGFTAVAPVLASSPTGTLSGRSYPTSLIKPDKLRLEPRVSIAWRPISGSSLLIRSSYGVYSDTSVYQATALEMAQQAPLSRSLSLSNSECALSLVNGFPSACGTLTPEIFGIDPNFRPGYAQMWTLSAQRDLPGALQMVVTYQGTKGTRGVQEFMPNTYPYGGTDPCPLCPSGFLYRTSNGNSTREAGIAQLRRRLRSGLTANLTYTFSKSLDDDYQLGGQGPVTAGAVSQGGGLTTQTTQIAQDWRNPAGQRGLSSFDQRHVLAASAQYTTGMGLGGKSMLSGWKGVLYKEWTFVTTIHAASGLPETPVYPVVMPGSGYRGILRADYTGAGIHTSGANKIFLNQAAFTAPVAHYGTARRNSIEGPSQFGLDASMARTFRLHDRWNLDAHIDATNLLNHVTYSGWYTSLPVTGTASLFGTPVGANGMRSMSATMRLRF